MVLQFHNYLFKTPTVFEYDKFLLLYSVFLLNVYLSPIFTHLKILIIPQIYSISDTLKLKMVVTDF